MIPRNGLASPTTDTELAKQTADHAVERIRALERRVQEMAVELSSQLSVARSSIQAVSDSVDDLSDKVATADKVSTATLDRIEAILRTFVAKAESGGPVPWSTPK